MASGITNKDSLFSVRETPWHGLGTIVQDALSSSEALTIAGLDWKVYPQAMYIGDKNSGNYIEVPNVIANVRQDTQEVLGTVTDKYKVCQNDEAFDFTDALLNDGEVEVKYETAGSLWGGRKVWMLAKLPETEVVGEKHTPFICFTNAHDGKGAIQVVVTDVRVVCQNTLNLALRGATRRWSTKHMGNMESKLAEARRTLNLAIKYQEAYKEEAARLFDEKITSIQFEMFVEKLIPITDESSQRQKDNAFLLRNTLSETYFNTPDLAPIRGTKWGVLQAVSDFETHSNPLRDSKTYKEKRLESAIGTGLEKCDLAYELLTN